MYFSILQNRVGWFIPSGLNHHIKNILFGFIALCTIFYFISIIIIKKLSLLLYLFCFFVTFYQFIFYKMKPLLIHMYETVHEVLKNIN